MGSSVKVPEPTAEERDLQRQQAETLKLQRQIIEDQRRQQGILLPFFAEQEGFKVETDANGNIKSISKIFDPLAAKRKELETGLLDRSLAALKGEAPVDPALEESLKTNEATLRERLTAQFGPGYETSTPGIKSVEEFNRTAEILRAGARTQQLTLAEQLGITREQQEIFRRQSSQDILASQSQGVPMTLAGAFGQNARGFGAAQQPFIEQRKMQLQASISNAQNKTAMFGAGIGAIGALFSDERLKENLVQIGTHSKLGIPIYTYNFKGDDTRHVGVLAADVAAIKPSAVYEREGWDAVQYGELG